MPKNCFQRRLTKTRAVSGFSLRDEPLREIEPGKRPSSALSAAPGRKCGSAGFTISPLSSIQLPRARMRTTRGLLSVHGDEAFRNCVVDCLQRGLGAAELLQSRRPAPARSRGTWPRSLCAAPRFGKRRGAQAASFSSFVKASSWPAGAPTPRRERASASPGSGRSNLLLRLRRLRLRACARRRLLRRGKFAGPAPGAQSAFPSDRQRKRPCE